MYFIKTRAFNGDWVFKSGLNDWCTENVILGRVSYMTKHDSGNKPWNELIVQGYVELKYVDG